MTTGIQCIRCINYIPYEDEPTCRAFLNGIPYEIISGEFDHTKPFPNDNGIRFVPMNAKKDTRYTGWVNIPKKKKLWLKVER